jgi:hypothetical protein
VETHAVPQEIMSVDFKLFGNFLSLREFLFVAIGLAIAWFFWFLMQKGLMPGLIAVPISFIIGGGGILIGLVPINEQPLDKWIIAYFTAIRKPTLRVWKKVGYQPNIATSDALVVTKDHVVTPPTQQQEVFMSAPLTKTPLQKVDSSVIAVEKAVNSDLQQIEETLASMGQATSEHLPSLREVPEQLSQTDTIPQTPSNDTYTLANSPTFTTVISQENTSKAPISGTIQITPQALERSAPGGSATSQQVQLSEGAFPPGVTVLPPIQQGASQQGTPLVNSQNSPAPMQHPPLQPVTGMQPVAPPSNQPTQVIVIDDKSINDYATTLPGLEEKPNTINLVVKDANGLIMPGVVCVIKNAHGDPVRAAISNILGQILNNIPLKDGMYKITLTKQGYVFPEVTRNLSGKVYPSIEIKSL